MAKTLRTLTGVVGHRTDHGTVKIVTDSSNPAFSILYLSAWAVRSAKRGDRVGLAYRVTQSTAEWVVTEILS